VIIPLGSLLPDSSSSIPGIWAGRPLSLFALLRTGFAWPTGHPVAGGLLHHLCTLTLRSYLLRSFQNAEWIPCCDRCFRRKHRTGSGSAFLLRILFTNILHSGRFFSVALSWGHPHWSLASVLPCGARTFLAQPKPHAITRSTFIHHLQDRRCGWSASRGPEKTQIFAKI